MFLNGQPSTQGFPPFLVGSSFGWFTCILIQPGPLASGQANTLSRNLRFFPAGDVGAFWSAGWAFVTVAVTCPVLALSPSAAGTGPVWMLSSDAIATVTLRLLSGRLT